MANEPTSEATHRLVMISEAARKNHEELFPNHKSTLKVTDPELIEVFDNFAFDEVLAHSKLDTKTRVILILASIIGSHAVSEFKIMVAAALNIGVTPIEIKEILYQSVPYVGMPRAFDFVHATNDVLAARGRSIAAGEPVDHRSENPLRQRHGGTERGVRHDDR